MLYIPFRSDRNGRKISYRHANRYEAPPMFHLGQNFGRFGLFQPVYVIQPEYFFGFLFIYFISALLLQFFSALSSSSSFFFFFFFLHLTPTPTRIRVSRSGGGRRSGLLVRAESAMALQAEQAGGKMVVLLSFFSSSPPLFLLLLSSSSFFFPPSSLSLYLFFTFYLLTFWFKCSLHVT